MYVGNNAAEIFKRDLNRSVLVVARYLVYIYRENCRRLGVPIIIAVIYIFLLLFRNERIASSLG